MAVLARVAAVSPFGPIFGKELRTTARRKRSYLLRVAYLGLLLLVLLMAYASVGRSYGGLAARAQQQAQLGMVFFGTFSMFCVITMGLIAPVLTCTAVGSERLARTLPVLLMTPINTWQILGGKLFSRLLAALMLIGLSLPVLALVRLLGGVELGQMAAVLCLAVTFAMSCAAIGLFFSTLMNRAYAVILLSYAALGVLYLLVPFVLMAGLELNKPRDIWIVAALNPVMCTVLQIEPRAGRMVGASWELCCGLQLVLTAVLVMASALVLRRSFQNAGERPAAVSPESYIPLAHAVAGLETIAAGHAGDTADGAAPPPLPMALASRVVPYTPPEPRGVARALGAPVRGLRFLLGMDRGRNHDVSDNPVLWREVNRPLLARPWQRVLAVAFCVLILLVVYATAGNDLGDPDPQTGFAIVFGGLAWLLMSVLSATAIAGEKEGDTWTLLLAAPLAGRQIVWGKVAGLYRRLVWPMALIVAHLGLFVLAGVIHPGSVLLVLWVILTFNSVWVAAGVYLSLKMKKVTFAVIANLMLAVVVYGVPPILLFVFGTIAEIGSRDTENLTTLVFWYLPYFWLGSGMYDLNRDLRHRSYGSYGYGYAADPLPFGLPGRNNHTTTAGFTAAVVFVGFVHLFVAFLILYFTARRFDAIVGRAGRQAYVGTFDTDEAVVPVGAAGYAPVWARLLAWLIDGAILRAAGAVVGVVAGFVVILSEAEHEVARRPERVLADFTLWGIVLSFAAALPCDALFEGSRLRATPGKSAMGIFVTDAEGRRITFARATLRAVGRLLPAALLLGGFALGLWDVRQQFVPAWIFAAVLLAGYALVYIPALFSERRQALHDRLARTVVLKR